MIKLEKIKALGVGLRGWFRGRRWFLLPGVVAGIVAAAVSYQDRQSVRAEVLRDVRVEERLVQVVVAGEAHKAGEPIRLSRLAMRDLPQGWLSGTPIPPDQAEAIEGQRVGRDLSPGMPIWQEDLRGTPETRSTDAAIPAGHRVIGLSTDMGGMQGLIRPGQLIDLWQVGIPARPLQTDGSGIELVGVESSGVGGRLIATGIRVMAVGGRTSIPDGGSHHAAAGGLSVLVPAAAVMPIMEAQSSARLMIALRGTAESGSTRKTSNRPAPVPSIEVLVHQRGESS
jgi:Flp pilus assembly protein CpaB